VTADGPAIQAEIGPIDYPDSYASPARFIKNKRTVYRDPEAPSDPSKLEWFCFTCSFRPWQDTGNATSAPLTVIKPGRLGERVRIVTYEKNGRWHTWRLLKYSERAFVAAGDVTDAFGNFNGQASATVSR
jgi:hypothetical protein